MFYNMIILVAVTTDLNDPLSSLAIPQLGVEKCVAMVTATKCQWWKQAHAIIIGKFGPPD